MKKTESPIYNVLLSLPLIKGVGVDRLTEIVGRYKLNFLKFHPGEVIMKAGEACESLVFILSGCVSILTVYPKNTLTVKQEIDGPTVLFADRLFGLDNTYPSTVTALETVSVLEISKEIYRKMLVADPVFLYNYLNRVCSASQRNAQWLDTLTESDPTARFIARINSLTLPGAKKIEIQSSTGNLKDLLCSGMEAIAPLEEQNLIKVCSESQIQIPDRGALAKGLNN